MTPRGKISEPQHHSPAFLNGTVDLTHVVNKLCEPSACEQVVHFNRFNAPMPSIEDLRLIMETLSAVVFPGYSQEAHITKDNIHYYTGAKLDMVFLKLAEQIKRGFCFVCSRGSDADCQKCEIRARDITAQFMESLPRIRQLLTLDVQAAYEGDPAAVSHGEVIFCYPSIRCLIHHRIAHQLYGLDVPIIPRIIAEMAHSLTGIDIHPRATIGERFFMDHGTGIVIGSTCEIGNNVRVYQNVTLGAKSFPLDENGKPIKGIPRHPVVEDDVIIYSGATILGRITLGKGSVVGGNVWLTHSIDPGTKIFYQPS